jgi:hypothetical protein
LHGLEVCWLSDSQKFYKLKKEWEHLKAVDGTTGPSTPAKTKATANEDAKTPGTGRGRKRKDVGAEDGGSTTKRTKKAAAHLAEEEPKEDEAQNDVKAGEESDADGVAD